MTLQNTKSLKKQIAPFEQSTTKQSIWQIINTLGPFIILWYLAYISLSVSYWLALIPAVFAAGFLTRIFIIFHDCTHHSFFKDRRANRIVGTIMGVLTLFPFDQWGHEHSVHHATSGNLDKRGTGDIWTLTVDEYLAAHPDGFDYGQIDYLATFDGSHPALMHQRIQQQDWVFNYNPAINNMSLKEKLLRTVERLTGRQFFIYKNYKILQ